MHRHNIIRRIPTISLFVVLTGLLFGALHASRAQDDFDLERLLGELEGEIGNAVSPAPAAIDDDLDALLGDLLGDSPVAVEDVAVPAAPEVDPFADLFDDFDLPEPAVEAPSVADVIDDFSDIAEIGIEDVRSFPDLDADLPEVAIGLNDLFDEVIPEIDEEVVVLPEEDLFDFLADEVVDPLPEVAPVVAEIPVEIDDFADAFDDLDDLDDLLGDLPMKGIDEDEIPPAVVDVPVAPSVELDDFDDLDLADFFDDVEEPAAPVAVVEPVEPAVEDPFADLDLDDFFADTDPEPVPEPAALEPEVVAPVEVPAPVEPPVEVAAPAPVVAPTTAPAVEAVEDVADRAAEIGAAEIIRRRAAELDGRRLIDRGTALLGEKRYEAAFRDLDAGLAMIPPRPDNEDLISRAKWGKSEAQYRMAMNQANAGNFDAASETLRMALQTTPNHRGALRLQSRLPRLRERRVFRADELPEIVDTEDRIRVLLHEGREYYSIGRYDEAERKFQQVRLLDPYNRDALRFLRRVDEARFRVSTIEREKTVADMMNQVRQRWSPPIEKDIEMIERPDGLPRPEITAADEIIQRMRDIIIPSLEFRNANIIDVVERLRQESERADPEGLGVNIVLRLDSGARQQPAAAPAAPAQDPFASDPFGNGFGFEPGGFDDFGAMDTGMGMVATTVPTVTLTLRRISLFDALQIITEYADLKFRVENRIVFITPHVDISRLETRIYAVQPSLVEVIVERQQDDQRSTGEFIELGSRTEMRRGDVRQFFEDAGVPFPPGTSIVYTPATSQLIVRNTEENLEIFERLLPHFNRPPPQVEIEARFVEVEQTDLEQLGVEWILTDNYEFAFRNDGSPASATQRLQIDATRDGFTKGLRFMGDDAAGIQGLSRTASSDGAAFLGNIMSFSSVLTNPELNVVLHALQQKGSADLLSAPRVTTRSGGIATIQVVTEIIYPTEFTSDTASSGDIAIASGDGSVIFQPVVIFPETFETREIGVILNVTPTVGADGFTIDLTLAPEVGELLGWIQYGTPPFNIPQPVFASRSVTTSIVIWDGQTVVLGGLIREELLQFDDKIPILGDIPILGRLFRSKGERSVKRNLMIFVTARIVDPAGRPVNTGSSFLSSAGSQPLAVDAMVLP